MRWPTLDELRVMVPLPQGYSFASLARTDIAPLMANIKAWYPQISVGTNSGYLREAFYEKKVCLAGEPERDIMVIQITFADEVIGVWSFEREIDSLAIYGRTLIVAPAHRGANLASFMLKGTESIGKAMGAAFMYAIATLRVMYVQRALENAGYRLLGFFPGYDREEVSPGVVKRVYQAVYAKLLVPTDEVLRPDPKNMTPKSRALFDLLFTDPPINSQ